MGCLLTVGFLVDFRGADVLRIFGYHVRRANCVVGAFEFALICSLFWASAQARPDTAALLLLPVSFAELVVLPALCIWITMYALGLYALSVQGDFAALAQRMLLPALVGGVVTALIYGRFVSAGEYWPFAQSTLPAIAAYFAILLNRVLLRWAVPALSLRPHILVLGTGMAAERLHRLSAGQAARPRKLHGFFDCESTHGTQRRLVPHNQIVSPSAPLSAYAVQHGISEIVVALDERRGRLPIRDLVDCRFHGIRVTDSATFYEREVRKVDLDNLYPSWLIFGDGFRHGRLTNVTKRAVDIAVSMTALVLALPLLVPIALAIAIDSPGSIFYRQERVGYLGRRFQILKFRSMIKDAEAAGRPQWATGDDPRITRVGHFLRKSRIDEIPQIINVLRGDMSFVGPRPERPEFVEELSENIRYFNDRHKVKPGLTGWAQVNFRYAGSLEETKEKLRYDLYYMKNHSVFLDAIIVLKTARVVLWPSSVR